MVLKFYWHSYSYFLVGLLKKNFKYHGISIKAGFHNHVFLNLKKKSFERSEGMDLILRQDSYEASK